MLTHLEETVTAQLRASARRTITELRRRGGTDEFIRAYLLEGARQVLEGPNTEYDPAEVATVRKVLPTVVEQELTQPRPSLIVLLRDL